MTIPVAKLNQQVIDESNRLGADGRETVLKPGVTLKVAWLPGKQVWGTDHSNLGPRDAEYYTITANLGPQSLVSVDQRLEGITPTSLPIKSLLLQVA